MTRIILVIGRIYSIQFYYSYLKYNVFFSQFFAIYMKSKSNVEHFEKKDDPDGLCIHEIREWERCG